MKKKELIGKIAELADITKAGAEKALEAYFMAVKRELKISGKFRMVGFGTFSVVKRKAREGRNPQTGDIIKIAAKRVLKFKVSKNYGGAPDIDRF